MNDNKKKLNDDEVVEIAEKILENYSILNITQSVDEQMLEYVDDDWENDGDYESEYDWYQDFGRNEAENDVIIELVNEYQRDNKIEFDIDSFIDIGKYIADKAGINY